MVQECQSFYCEFQRGLLLKIVGNKNAECAWVYSGTKFVWNLMRFFFTAAGRLGEKIGAGLGVEIQKTDTPSLPCIHSLGACFVVAE
jgi:hypothetical protein